MSRFKWILRNTKTNEVFELRKDPKEWEDLRIKHYRSEQYHGIFMEPSTKKLTFLSNGGGKEFIDQVYQTDDINGSIELTCKIASNGSYKNLFKGKLNLAQWTEDGESTSLNVEQSDLYNKLMSRAAINVDMESDKSIGGSPITPATLRNITLPSVAIFMKDTWDKLDTLVISLDPVSPTPTYFHGGIITERTQITRNEIDSASDITNTLDIDVEPNMPTFDVSSASPVFVFNPGDFIQAPAQFNFNWNYIGQLLIDGLVVFPNVYKMTGEMSLNIAYGPDMGTAFTQQLFSISWNNQNFPGSININQTGNTIVNLNEGDSLWVYWGYKNKFLIQPGSPGGSSILPQLTFIYNERTFDLSIDSVYDDSVSKSIMVHEAFNQAVDSVADGDGKFYSEIFGRTDSAKQAYISNGKEAFLALTNGGNIRQFSEKSLVFSIEQLFRNLYALLGIGLGIMNDKIRVEALSFFYNKDVRLLQLGYVPDFTVANENSKYINDIMVGYEKWETAFKGGLDEPCTKRQYSTIINSIRNSYQKTCSIISSSYAIEATRRKNRLFFPSEDWRYDNDAFFLALNSNYSIQRYGNGFSSGANMVSLPTAYNLRLTPARMLLAHFHVIAAGLQKIKGDISFIPGEGNFELEVAKANQGMQGDYNGQLLSEKQNFSWNDPNVANREPLWLPETYTFDYYLTQEQYEAIAANPYGYIEFFQTPSKIYRGFILEADYLLKNGKTTFKLLRRYGN